MGQVGGNGSVVWQNEHRPKNGKFKCKRRGKLKHDELGLDDEKLEVWGHDETPIENIGSDPAAGLERGLEGFQQPGYFLVRLRFDAAEADALSKWYEAIGPNLPPALIRLIRVGSMIILAINVRAIRRESEDGISWPNLPFEIRYDW